MDSLTFKILAGVATLGSLVTVTYFGWKTLFRSFTIKKHLDKEKFKFIPFSDTKQWEEEFKSDKLVIKDF